MTTETQPLRGPLRKRESHLWERDEHDWYVEPEWCSQRLFEKEIFLGEVFDPACGLGRIVIEARNAGLSAGGMDLVDRGYDSTTIRRGLQARRLVPRLAMRRTKHGNGLGRWRWVVERTFAWLSQFRRLRVRYEKRADIHEAFLSLGCALICWQSLRKTWRAA